MPSSSTISPPPLAVRLMSASIASLVAEACGSGIAADPGRAHERNHLVAVSAENERRDVFDGRAGLPRDERSEAGGVEDAGHAEHAFARKTRGCARHVTHGVERIGDDDDHRLGSDVDHPARHVGDDPLVRRHEIVAAHSGCSSEPRGDHHDRRSCRGSIVVRADDVGLVAEQGAHLIDVEGLALGQPVLDVDQDDVRVVRTGDRFCAGRPDVPGADDRELGSGAHRSDSAAPRRAISASATALVPTALGSSREGFMS